MFAQSTSTRHIRLEATAEIERGRVETRVERVCIERNRSGRVLANQIFQLRLNRVFFYF